MFEKRKSSKQGNPQINESLAMQESPSFGKAPLPGSTSAIIGPGIEISGDVTASADLLINGRVKGSIVQSSHNVEIGESGQVIARVRAKLVKVSGEVRGDLTGDEKVLISRSGRVLGNISAPRVQLDDGAIFKGSIDMTPAETAKPAAAPAEKKAVVPPKVEISPDSDTKTGGNASTPAVRKDAERKEPSLTLKSG